MNKKYGKYAALAVIVIAAASPLVHAQTPSRRVMTMPKLQMTNDQARKFYQAMRERAILRVKRKKVVMAYLNSKWTGDDSSYSAVRREIDQKFAKAPKPLDVYNGLQMKYRGDSVLDLYARAAATDIFMRDTKLSTRERQNMTQTYIDQFTTLVNDGKAPAPSYNLIRTIWLVYANNHAFSSKLVPIGERLYSKELSDSVVENYLAAILSCENNVDEFNRAVRLQQDLEHRYPSDPRSFELKGEIYLLSVYGQKFDNATYQHSIEYLQIAAQAYDKAASMARTANWPIRIREEYENEENSSCKMEIMRLNNCASQQNALPHVR